MAKPKSADLATVSFVYLGVSYERMDCQEFVEACLRKVGISLNLPGSNAWYRKMTWTGSPEECKVKFGSVPPGAFLYILEHDSGEPEKYKSDGIGNASHMGLVTGQGDGAIHSSQSKGCVAESKFSGKTVKNGGWNRVGLWDQIDYGDRINAILTGKSSVIDDQPKGDGKPMGYQATVWADNGLPVRLRKKPTKQSDPIKEIPVLTPATVLEDLGEWSKINTLGLVGYMQSKFLSVDDKTPTGDGSTPDGVTVSRAKVEKMYDELGDWLGLRG